MKKVLYNLSLVGAYTVGAVWALVLLNMQFQKDVDRSTEAIILCVLLVLVPLIHYGMMYVGQKKNSVWTGSVIILCVVDMASFGLIWVVTTWAFLMASVQEYLYLILSFDLLSFLYLLVIAWVGLRVYSTLRHFGNRKERAA